MTLRERVEREERDQIRVRQEMGDTERKLRYTYVSLDQSEDTDYVFQSAEYFNFLGTPSSITIPFGKQVLLQECKGGEVVDTCRISRQEKIRIYWKIESAAKYGTNAYKITLRWEKAGHALPIHPSRIWLEAANEEIRFHFLANGCVGPERGRTEDAYIIEPRNINVADLRIVGDEFLQSICELVG